MLQNKNGIIFGVANKRSIAWATAQALHEAGATVCLKSDSNEPVRHLYQEAAKLIKYGGLGEDDALKAIIDAKIEGKEVVMRAEEEPKVVDIMTALKASIDAAKKPMEKAKGTTAKKAKEEKPKTAKRKAS